MPAAASVPSPMPGVPRPLTPRGERTRRALVEGARRVFERDGYHDARLADITAESGVSVGTFYLYFDGKDQALVAVLEQLEAEMLAAGRPERREREPRDPVARIEAANRAYLAAYRDRAPLMLLLEQAATLQPAFRAMRSRRGRTFTQRNAAQIERLQREGHADPTLDPLVAARALSGMVARLAYYEYALRPDDADEERRADADEALVRTATTLWVNALAIRPPLRP